MNFHKIYIFLLFSILFFQCSENSDGDTVEKYILNNLYKKYTINKKGEKHGRYREFNPWNGWLVKEFHYYNGVPHSSQILFDTKEKYQVKEENGVFEIYNPNYYEFFNHGELLFNCFYDSMNRIDKYGGDFFYNDNFKNILEFNNSDTLFLQSNIIVPLRHSIEVKFESYIYGRITPFLVSEFNLYEFEMEYYINHVLLPLDKFENNKIKSFAIYLRIKDERNKPYIFERREYFLDSNIRSPKVTRF